MDSVRQTDPPDVRAYLFGDFELDLWTLELRADGCVRALEPKTHRLLAYLVQHRNRVVPMGELQGVLWEGVAVSRGTLPQCVWTARKAIGDDSRRQAFIRTLKGAGYRFVAPVAERRCVDERERATLAKSALAVVDDAIQGAQRALGVHGDLESAAWVLDVRLRFARLAEKAALAVDRSAAVAVARRCEIEAARLGLTSAASAARQLCRRLQAGDASGDASPARRE